jgi:peptidoglycan/xylan/chitin deacetylase (PgdA/CDA1 family)
LLYHAVGEGAWAINTREFARHMEFIARETRALSLVQALGTQVDRPLEVVVTFDDGYASVFTQAFPILKSLGLTASMFLNTSPIGVKERTRSDPREGHYPEEEFLLWSEVDALVDSGWVIGSHGEHHLDHSREPDTVVRRELRESKKRIEEVLPGSCLYFAYTWGRHTHRLRRLIAEAGYHWGLSGDHRAVRSSDDPFAIPRINIDHTYTLDDLKAVLRGDWDYLRFLQAWRTLRS